MLSRAYLDCHTVAERQRLLNAQLRSGAPATGYAAYDNLARRDSFYVGTGNVSSCVQRSSFIRAFGMREGNGGRFAPGELMEHDLKTMRGTFLSPLMGRAIRDPERTSPLILYHFFLPSAKGRVDLGTVLTEKDYRHVAHVSPNVTQKRAAAFRDLAARVSWVDTLEDPIPGIADTIAAFAGRDDAEDVIGAAGYEVIGPASRNADGDRYGFPEDRGQIYGVPRGADSMIDAIEASSLAELAGRLTVRAALRGRDPSSDLPEADM